MGRAANGWFFVWVVGASLVGAFASPAIAADPDLVGYLALAADETVATQIQLTPEQRAKLEELFNARDKAALTMAREIRTLSEADQKLRMDAFVAESETLGERILDAKQRERLKQLRLAKRGVRALVDPAVAKALNLTDAQRGDAQRLVSSLEQVDAGATDQARRAAEVDGERKLLALLTVDQRATWERLTSASGDTVTIETAPGTAANPASDESSPRGAAPATTKLGGPRPRGGVGFSDESTPRAKPSGDGKVRFNFKFAPWKDVLEYFAQEADLALQMDAPPQGTFNYSDAKRYTPAEAIDLINGVLQLNGYTLIRRGRMLIVHNLEDALPPGLVPEVKSEKLDEYGEYELVGCLFTLSKLTPEEAEVEVKKLLGPQGMVAIMPKMRQIYIQETAGKLRTIRTVIDAVENPPPDREEQAASVPVSNLTLEQVMTGVRPLLGIPDGTTALPDGSLKISLDVNGQRFLLWGRGDKIDRFKKIVELVDVPESAPNDPLAKQQPQFEVYPISATDPDAAVAVLKGMFPEIANFIMKDPKSGNIVALAKPGQQASIKATIDQLQRDKREVEVIKLKRTDPEMAVVSINKMFGGAEGEATKTGPQVDADLTANQLIVRGTTDQLSQIKDLLKKLGESDERDAELASERSNVRRITVSGRSAKIALEQVEVLWPMIRPNQIRIVRPQADDKISTSFPALPEPRQPRRPTKKADGEKSENAKPEESKNSDQQRPSEPAKDAPKTEPPKPAGEKSASRTRDKRAAKKAPLPWQWVVQEENGEHEDEKKFADAITPEDEEEQNDADPKASKKERPSVPGAEIVVTFGPGGLMIASEDLDALDEFEELLSSIVKQSGASGREYSVYYLKFAKADVAASLLAETINASGGSAEAGGGNMMQGMAENMLGPMGGMMGALMGMGGSGGGSSSSSSTAMKITPDGRLNALIIQAKPSELDLVDQLLKVIDQPQGPDPVQTQPRPRFIPVKHADVEQVATVVRQAFAARMAQDASQPRQPSPEDFIRAMRGGGGRGGREQAKSEEPKMTVAVEKKSNSLIVAAPDYVFQDVVWFVEQLDRASEASEDTTAVVRVKGASTDVVTRALRSLASNVTVNQQQGANPQQGNRGANGGGVNGQQGDQQARQTMEFFNNLQRQMRGGGGGGPGGGAPGGAPGGGGGRGGARGPGGPPF